MKSLRVALFCVTVLGSLVIAAGAVLGVMAADGVVGASAPATISSVTLPPTSERSVVFSDRGRTYLVGVTSGKVIVVDGSAPPPPYNPPAPSLTGLAKATYDSVMALPVDAQNRTLGVAALSNAIDSAISEAGGLSIQDPQAIVNLLANNSESSQIGTLLKGFKLGDILAGSNISTREQLLTALGEIKRGLGAIK